LAASPRQQPSQPQAFRLTTGLPRALLVPGPQQQAPPAQIP